MRPVVRLAAVVAGVALAVVVGTVALLPDDGPDPPPAPIMTAPAPPERATPAPPPPAPPAPPEDGFATSPHDVEPAAKQAAVRFVEGVGAWESAAPVDAVTRLAEAGYGADLAATATPLLDTSASESATTVIYPQYGGLTPTAASVMVLARQTLRTDTGEQTRDVVLDVRLAPQGDRTWRVVPNPEPPRPELAPYRAGGPTPMGRAVLENPRVRISGPGRADIVGRRVGDPILAVLDIVARTRTVDVHVVVSGHPSTVFSTTRLSNHAVGRAVDIWAVDGRSVIDIPRADPVLAALMVEAGAAGATEVGGPLLPGGLGFFTDAVHQDHLHLGISPGKPPASAAQARTGR